MSDIAERAAVSRATVSYVLNGRHSDRLSEETQQRVWEAARALGYRRNEMARAIVTGRSRVIGVLTYDNSFENMAHIVAGALDEAVGHGYSAKLIHVPFYGTREQIREVMGLCTSWQLDGVVGVSLRQEAIECLCEEVQASGKPVAYIETRPQSEEGSDESEAIFIRTDDEDALRQGIEHLVGLGHARIAFLGGPEGEVISTARAKYFRRLMGDAGLPLSEASVAFGSWNDVPPIEAGTRRLLDVPEPPTALICAGERIGFVAMRTARRMGLPVPERLSVLGFGEAQVTVFSDPPLTTLAQPFREMGVVAVRQLLALIEPQGSPQVLEAPPEEPTGPSALGVQLVVRESTGPPYDSAAPIGLSTEP